MKRGFKFTINWNKVKPFTFEVNSQNIDLNAVKFGCLVGGTLCAYQMARDPPFTIGGLLVFSAFGAGTGALIGANWRLLPYAVVMYGVYKICTYEIKKKKD